MKTYALLLLVGLFFAAVVVFLLPPSREQQGASVGPAQVNRAAEQRANTVSAPVLGSETQPGDSSVRLARHEVTTTDLELFGWVRDELGSPVCPESVVVETHGDPATSAGWSKLMAKPGPNGFYRVMVPRAALDSASIIRIQVESEEIVFLGQRVDICGPFAERGRERVPDLVCRRLSASVVGLVVAKESREPVAGATVILDRGSLRVCKTGSDGRFSMRSDAQAPVRGLLAYAPGFAYWHSERAESSAGVEIKRLANGSQDVGTIELRAGAVAARGKVVDESGNRLRGVVIGCHLLPSWMGETAEDGTFVVPSCAPGAWLRLMFWSPNHADAHVEYQATREGKPIEVVLKRKATVSGSVCFDDDVPVRSGYVVMRAQDGTAFWGRIEGDGRFEVVDTQMGNSTVVVVPLDGAELVKKWNTSEPARLIKVSRGAAAIMGRVVDSEGRPCMDVVVAGAYSVDGEWVHGERREVTAEDGSFSLTGVGSATTRLAIGRGEERQFVAINEKGVYALPLTARRPMK